MTSDQAPVWWPFIAAPGLPPTGAQMGIDLLSGGPFYADPAGWVLDDTIPVTNPNMFVFGKPGRGKSATVKAFLLRMMDFGYRALILGDPKDEYEQLCRALGVEPIRIGPGQPVRINPLAFGPLAHGWDQLSGSEAQARAAVVFGRWLTLVRGLVGSQRIGEHRVPFSPSDEAVVKTALADLTGYAAGHSRLHEVTVPQLWAALDQPSDALVAGCRYRDARQFWDETRLLRDSLGQLVTGALAGMFDAHTTIDVDWRAPIQSLSLSRLEPLGDDAVGVALTCLNSWGRGMREVADPGDVRIVVRDESWKQLRLGVEAVKSFDADLRLSRSTGDIQCAVGAQTVRPAVGRRPRLAGGRDRQRPAAPGRHHRPARPRPGRRRRTRPAPRPRPDRPTPRHRLGHARQRPRPVDRRRPALQSPDRPHPGRGARSPTPTRPSAHNRGRADPMSSEGRRGPVPLTVQAAWSGTLLAALLQQVDHLRDPKRALVRSALGGVNPAQPLGAVKLRKRVERCTRIRVSVERGRDVGGEIGPLRSFRFEDDLDLGAVGQRVAGPRRAERDDGSVLGLLDGAAHEPAGDRSAYRMAGLGTPDMVGVERDRHLGSAASIDRDDGPEPFPPVHGCIVSPPGRARSAPRGGTLTTERGGP